MKILSQLRLKTFLHSPLVTNSSKPPSYGRRIDSINTLEYDIFQVFRYLDDLIGRYEIVIFYLKMSRFLLYLAIHWQFLYHWNDMTKL